MNNLLTVWGCSETGVVMMCVVYVPTFHFE